MMDSKNDSKPLVILWVAMMLSLTLAAVGWYKVYSGSKKTRQAHGRCKEALRTCEEEKESVTANAPRSGGSMGASKADSLNPDHRSRSKQINDAALERLIAQKAKALAEKLSAKKVGDYIDDEKSKKAQKFHKFMDTLETGMVSAANRYIEDKNVSEEVAKKMHSIIESGFETHRKNFQRLQRGELTETEARAEGGKVYKRDREATVALLGEEEAKEYGQYIREEMKKAFEKQQAEEKEKENN
ncbi:hypothetical protein KKF84_07950 [Myxococcota bacterium]|nr:hypothetical protein [Myxococcota bacterium]MBU1535239.1 hypothetical protein [Myxococcota bacterium]